MKVREVAKMVTDYEIMKAREREAEDREFLTGAHAAQPLPNYMEQRPHSSSEANPRVVSAPQPVSKYGNQTNQLSQ